ncbi:MAG: 4-alpha-glucanotransferase, partial [Candidatus Omnitrophica bacterium]|nr:4-alpha-glucanotransferase [Candidatus Omnitrophota bacterium]
MMLKIQEPYNLLQTASGPKWQRIGLKRRSGIVVPLFSVYSRNSIGIGDVEDLRLVVDWAAETKNSIVQLLPMNEISGLFCPYDSISSFALEPAYICLRGIPFIRKSKIKERLDEIKERFPVGLSNVDYGIKYAKIS